MNYAKIGVAVVGFISLFAGLRIPAVAQVTPLKQTIRGVTVTLSGIQWQMIDSPNPLFPFTKDLYVDYTVQANPPLPLPPTKGLLDCITNVGWVGPDGSTLFASGSGKSMDSSGQTIAASAYTNSIDPRWPFVVMQMDFNDPSTPAAIAGEDSGIVTITGIPMPTQSGTTLPCHVLSKTPMGAQIVVDTVMLGPGTANGWKLTNPGMAFIYHIVPPPNAPDLQFLPSGTAKGIDNTGQSLGDASISGSGPSAGFNGFLIGFSKIPNSAAKTAALAIDYTEQSPWLEHLAPSRHFRIKIPFANLYEGEGRNHFSVMSVKGKEVYATLDSLTQRLTQERARFVLSDQIDPGATWTLASLTGITDSGSPLSARITSGERGPAFYWEVDGEPLAAGQNAAEAIIGTTSSANDRANQGPMPTAKSVTLTATFAAEKLERHVLDFRNVHVPPPGKTISLNKTSKDAFGGTLTLQSVTSYDLTKPLPQTFGAADKALVAPAGLVLVLSEPPSSEGYPEVDYQLAAAHAPNGDSLLPATSLTCIPGDAFQGAPSQALIYNMPTMPPPKTLRLATLLVYLPQNGAQAFNLEFERNEIIPLHREETLTFQNIQMPPPYTGKE